MRAGTFQKKEKSTETELSLSSEEIISPSWTTLQVLEHLLDNPIRSRSAKTVRTYRGYLNHDIAPIIGHVPLKDVTYEILQRLFTQIAAREGISPHTVNSIRRYLNAEFNELWRRRKLIASNPVLETVPIPTPPHKIVTWTLDEIEQMLDAAPHAEARAMLALSYYFGLRAGEVGAIRFKDYDPDNRMIYIEKAVRWVGQKFELYDCKAHSQREIPLVGDVGDYIFEAIEAHLRDSDKPRGSSDFLFPQSPGRPRYESTLNRWHHKAIDRANTRIIASTKGKVKPKLIEHGKLHGGRSTTVTELHRQGIPLESIRRLVGHRSVETTRRHYLEITTEDLSAALKNTTRRAK